MWFKIILNYICGYVNIEIEGYYVERLINTCIKKEIFLWGIKRTKSEIIEAKTGLEEYKKMEEISKEFGCIIRAKKEKGIPNLIKKYKKRKIFLLLVITTFAVIIACSNYVWNIEVEGSKKVNKDEIMKEAENEGLKIGTLKSKIKIEKIINEIRIKRTDIAWIGIELKGTNAIIKVVEADEKPEIIEENDYCNIVASKGGIIENISAQNGTIMVQKGREVKKGDILIAGWMEGKYTDKYYVNSNGNIKARVKYTQKEKIDKKEIKREQTGKISKKYAIKLNNFKINFYKKLSKFEKYDTIYSNKKIELFSDFYLPIELVKYTSYEVTESELLHNIEEAKEIAKQKAEKTLKRLDKRKNSKYHSRRYGERQLLRCKCNIRSNRRDRHQGKN